MTKFLQEHGSLCTWLEQNEQELHSLGEGETDAQGLKGRLEEHRKVQYTKYTNNIFKMIDVVCHVILIIIQKITIHKLAQSSLMARILSIRGASSLI